MGVKDASDRSTSMIPPYDRGGTDHHRISVFDDVSLNHYLISADIRAVQIPITSSIERHAPWQHPAIRRSLQQLGAVAAEPVPELASISSVLETDRLNNKWIKRYGDRM